MGGTCLDLVEAGGDGVVEVGYEVGDAASQPDKFVGGRGAMSGFGRPGSDGPHLGESFQVAVPQVMIENDAPEGVGLQARGPVGMIPMDGGGDDGVGGGTAQRIGGAAAVARGQVNARAIEVMAAAELMMGYGSDVGCSFLFYIDIQDARDFLVWVWDGAFRVSCVGMPSVAGRQGDCIRQGRARHDRP